MDTVHDTFAVWRADIASELEAARAQLAPAEAEHAAAADAASSAKAERRAIRDAIARLDARRPIANALACRLKDHEANGNRADGRLSMARQNVEATRRMVRDLEDALGQIDEVMRPAVADAA